MQTLNKLQAAMDDESFLTFFENMLSPAWIYSECGHALFMNKQALAVWNLDAGYKFKHAYDLFPKQVAERFLASDKAVLKSGLPHSSVAESPRPDGSIRHILLKKMILLSKTGNRLVAGQAIDITDQVIAKKALDQSNERFEIIAKAISDCIWDFDLETGHMFRSEALITLTGYSKDHIENSLAWWEQKTHPDDRGTSIYHFEKVLEERGSYCEGEYRFLCADHQYRHFYDKGFIIYDEGKPVRAIGIVHDVTESKTLQEKNIQESIQKQQEITRAIIATQDHVSNELGKELHDNVNQILATVSMMLHTIRNEEKIIEIDMVQQSHEYVLLAMEEIRKLSKSLNTTVIKDVGLITSVNEIIRQVQRNMNIKATLTCAQVMEEKLSNDQKLTVYRIIQEQVNNIIKHAQATALSIKLEILGEYYHLTISDNGKGFNPPSVKRGIGLANIRSRVELSKGRLQINTAPGKGCSLKASFPLKESTVPL